MKIFLFFRSYYFVTVCSCFVRLVKRSFTNLAKIPFLDLLDTLLIVDCSIEDDGFDSFKIDWVSSIFSNRYLIDVTKKFPDTEYHPEQFPGLVFRLKVPRTATLVFRTGKMVCTGAKSEEMAIKAVRTVVQKLRKGGIKIKKDAVIVVQNIVAAINLGGKIHLEQAARSLPRSMYEPEQFPGLIHRMLDPKTVILLFASGKLVCTGAKKEADVYRSVHNLHALLEEKKLMIYDA